MPLHVGPPSFIAGYRPTRPSANITTFFGISLISFNQAPVSSEPRKSASAVGPSSAMKSTRMSRMVLSASGMTM